MLAFAASAGLAVHVHGPEVHEGVAPLIKPLVAHRARDFHLRYVFHEMKFLLVVDLRVAGSPRAFVDHEPAAEPADTPILAGLPLCAHLAHALHERTIVRGEGQVGFDPLPHAGLGPLRIDGTRRDTHSRTCCGVTSGRRRG